MTPDRPRETPPAGQICVPHASAAPGARGVAADASRPACAHCGGPAGSPRPGVRFCSSRCRFAAVRDRRAKARSELFRALSELRSAKARVEAALAVLGLAPKETP